MPKKTKPAYTLHKPTGQARVRIDGRDFYLGPHASPESWERYQDLVSEWLIRQDLSGYTLTVDDLCLMFLKFAEGYYRRKDGTPTRTIDNMREALRYLVRSFGTTRVRDFGPKKLKAVRQDMIDDGRCRKSINSLVHRVRRVFRWGVEEELVPASVYHALTAVSGLKAGRSKAKESEPVKPVSDEVVETTIKHTPAVIADMVRFQRLTGCRPSEVCVLRPCDVDRTNDIWRYTPDSHKTEHCGRQRIIMIGPQAQSILLPYLLREENAYCFSPRDSERRRLSARHEKRTTPLVYGNRPGTNRKPNRKRSPAERYNKDSFARAVSRACDKAYPPPSPLAKQKGETHKHWQERLTQEQLEELKAWRIKQRWSPNRLRHTTSTEIRKGYGLEAAQVVLGHATADVTQVYAERDFAKAAEIMREIG